MKNRQSMVLNHETIELDEEMLKSYDEKARQEVIGDNLNLI